MPPHTTHCPPEAMSMAQVLASPYMSAKAILADLDGTLVSGGIILPGVIELLAQAQARIWLVSNNSTQTAVSMSAHLRKIGLDIPATRILLAGETAIRALAKRHPDANIVFFGEAPLRDLAQELGLKTHRGTEPATCAFLAREETFSMADLGRLMALLHDGMELHLSNPDPIYPNADGSVGAETGALYAALKAGLPHLEAKCLAKPSPHLLEAVLKQAKVAPEEAVFLGDTDATDGAAARAAGIPFLLLARPKLAKEYAA